MEGLNRIIEKQTIFSNKVILTFIKWQQDYLKHICQYIFNLYNDIDIKLIMSTNKQTVFLEQIPINNMKCNNQAISELLKIATIETDSNKTSSKWKYTYVIYVEEKQKD